MQLNLSGVCLKMCFPVKKIFVLHCLVFLFVGLCSLYSKDKIDPEKALSGFESRIAAIFKAEAGKPQVRAKVKPPLKKNRSKYARQYSYSIIGFAARCFYLGEKLTEANAAFARKCPILFR